MAGKWLVSVLLPLLLLGCPSDEPKSEPPPSEPVIIFRPKPQGLTEVQRIELGFPEELISLIERMAGAKAEPFYETIYAPSENLKAGDMIEQERLSGFSVRTTKADGLISRLSQSLRARGYLIFKSKINYGELPDIVTVIRGKSTYDIIKVQHTEAPSYQLDTKAIIAWLKARQKDAPFVITGAGPDWIEARFIRPPRDALAFARSIAAFAPDVITQGHGSIEHLAAEIKRTNRFFIWWY